MLDTKAINAKGRVTAYNSKKVTGKHNFFNGDNWNCLKPVVLSSLVLTCFCTLFSAVRGLMPSNSVAVFFLYFFISCASQNFSNICSHAGKLWPTFRGFSLFSRFGEGIPATRKSQSDPSTNVHGSHCGLEEILQKFAAS